MNFVAPRLYERNFLKERELVCAAGFFFFFFFFYELIWDPSAGPGKRRYPPRRRDVVFVSETPVIQNPSQ